MRSGKRTVATIELEIVNSYDRLLIAAKGKIQYVKKVEENMKKR